MRGPRRTSTEPVRVVSVFFEENLAARPCEAMREP